MKNDHVVSKSKYTNWSMTAHVKPDMHQLTETLDKIIAVFKRKAKRHNLLPNVNV